MTMKMIVDHFGITTSSADFRFVGVVHVDDHGPEPMGSLLAKPAKELPQGDPVAVSANPNDATFV